MSITPAIELKLYDHTQGPRKIGPKDGKFVEADVRRRPLHGVGRGDRRGLLAGRAPDRAKHAGRASPHPRARGRVPGTCSRGAWARCSATRSSTRTRLETSSSSRATSGTRSGTPATRRAGSSRSSARRGVRALLRRAGRAGRAAGLLPGEDHCAWRTLRALLRPRADGSRSRGARPPLPDAGVARRLSPRAYARPPNSPPSFPHSQANRERDRLSK